MSWWNYLLLVNVYLLLFYGFYALLLRRETFFQLNRVYLVAAALLSFFIPLIQSNWVKNLFITKQVQQTIYSSPIVIYHFQPLRDNQVTLGQLLAVVYIGVIVFLTGRFVWQLISLKKVIDQPESTVPYSFFKKIKLGDQQENREIISAHEHVHARQWHSADVLLIEAVMIINWFNPVVYFYRFAIKHIHEFIADRQAVKSGTNKTDYALLLLSQTFNAPAHQLVNPFFNHSLLKQRIMMLQKSKSHRIALIKYCLSAPLFILMLVLSSATVNNSKTIRFINKKTELIFLSPAVNNSKVDVKRIINILLEKKEEKETSNPAAGKKFTIIMLKDTVPGKGSKVFSSVEKIPEFPGGINAFYNFLSRNIKYPDEARQKGVQGRVIVSFIVEKDGSLTNFKIARGVGSGTDEEAIRVLALSPTWSPGLQNGEAVRVAYSVPISFTLPGEKPVGVKVGVINKDGNSNSQYNAGFIAAMKDTAIRINTAHFNSVNQPLIVVDGKIIDNSAMQTLNPSNIESIEVLKGESAKKFYGEKGANGVVIITSKKTTVK
jgi:TonB family protein